MLHRIGPGLARKHWNRLEMLARDKHSSLLRKSINYGFNEFDSTGPWQAFPAKSIVCG